MEGGKKEEGTEKGWWNKEIQDGIRSRGGEKERGGCEEERARGRRFATEDGAGRGGREVGNARRGW